VRDPQVKTPAPGLETGSHPKKRRHHGQPAPTLTPHSSARHRRPRPYGGSDPRPGTTCTGRDFHAVATIPRMKWLRRPVSAARQPAYSQVSCRMGVSESDHDFPALTNRSGTQRARSRPRRLLSCAARWLLMTARGYLRDTSARRLSEGCGRSCPWTLSCLHGSALLTSIGSRGLRSIRGKCHAFRARSGPACC